ncbi:MAG: hypothetical protein WCL44_03555 [bacterium]
MNPLNIGSRRELFVDHVLIDRLENVRLRLHEPVSGGVVVHNDKPWEGPANFGMSVIELDGRLLLYYRGWALTDAADQNGVGCVAESRDGGATWTKPVLNRVTGPDCEERRRDAPFGIRHNSTTCLNFRHCCDTFKT